MVQKNVNAANLKGTETRYYLKKCFHICIKIKYYVTFYNIQKINKNTFVV